MNVATPMTTVPALTSPAMPGDSWTAGAAIDKDAGRYWNNLLLVRHGESTCNEVNRFAGSVDAPLTRLGKAQARQAAETWQGMPPDHLFVSPLLRARQTAEILFPRNAGPVTHQIDSRIAERQFGDFTLRNKAELQTEFGIRGYDEALYDPTDTITGAESFAQFHDRVAQFLFETIVPLLRVGRRVLVVAHKYVVELIVRLIQEIPPHNGFDLRLPNSRVLCGGDVRRYCKRESRILNRFREWVVVHHGRLLAASALSGLMAAIAGFPIALHWSVSLALLMMTTLISLTRVDLAGLRSTDSPSWPRVFLRFAVLPCIIGWFGLGFQSEISLPLICAALILAAPAAITSVTLSRCAGGLVLPAVGAIFRSSVTGCAAMVVLYQLLLGSAAWRLAPLLLAVALVTILVPCALAYLLRRRAPIATANWGERHASISVLLLCGFVCFSCAHLDPQSFFFYGVAAMAAGLLVRVAAWCIARHGTLRAADDYLSTAYPNLFVVIVLGQLLGFVELTQMATWLLLPMFLLVPFDVRVCRRFESTASNESLRNYLGIQPTPNYS